MERYYIVAEYSFVPPRIVVRDNFDDANEWYELEKTDIQFVRRVTLYKLTTCGVMQLKKTYTEGDGEHIYD